MQKPLHQLSQNPRYSALMAAARAMRNWPSRDDHPDGAASRCDGLRDTPGYAYQERATARPVIDQSP